MDETDSKVASITITEENGCQISYDGYYCKVDADLAIDMQPILEMLNIAHSSSPAPDPDHNTDTDTVLQKPPNLTLSVNGQEGIKTFRGTYSWTVLNEDGTSFSMEADSMQVLEAKEEMTPVMLDPKQDSFYGVTLNFELAPDKVIVHRWSGEFWNKPYVNGEIIEVECVEPEPVSGYTGSLTPTYMFILKNGNYIYEVYVEWNNSDKYEGSAYYGFYTSTSDR